MAFPYGSIKPLSGVSRVRVVISKKVSAKAVDRNRLRRRIRAIVHDLRPDTPQNFAVYPNKKALSVSFAELKHAFTQVLK